MQSCHRFRLMEDQGVHLVETCLRSHLAVISLRVQGAFRLPAKVDHPPEIMLPLVVSTQIGSE